MTEPTYYTPEISEFYIGFEYEYKSSLCYGLLTKYDCEGEWKKEVFSALSGPEDEASEIEDIQRSLDGDPQIMIRVKHLDRQDIESLGWESETILKYNSDDEFIEGFAFYNDEWVQYNLYNLEDNKWLTWRQVMYNEHSGNWTAEEIFSGTIKNKSELSRLMKMIGIT